MGKQYKHIHRDSNGRVDRVEYSDSSTSSWDGASSLTQGIIGLIIIIFFIKGC